MKAILRKKRTELGKMLRKAYESRVIGYKTHMRDYEPRHDGLSNTITTLTKDNLLITIHHEPTK